MVILAIVLRLTGYGFLRMEEQEARPEQAKASGRAEALYTRTIAL